ncbi:hypothetical protein QYF36_010762 [Acer negundo]|nr:hypothetical protein QYF36_010762 [Acer negundo]
MMNRLKVYENDSKVRLVILKGTGRAFCAGGDVVALYRFMTAGHWSFGASFFKKFSNLEYLVATYKKPLVALIDGMVMGGGAGVSMLARFKIVTENTNILIKFSSENVYIGACYAGSAIGSYVGETYFLSRLPGYLGEYLGLTGARIDGAEMIACGLATHFVCSKDLQALENALSEVAPSETIEISQLISKFIGKPNLKQSSAISRLEIVNKCFSGETVEDILLTLWQPSKLELVEEEMVDRCFGRVDEADWEPLQLPPRSNLVHDNNVASKL